MMFDVETGFPTGTMPTILLADDNADSRDIYRTLFTLAGYHVLEAENGERAVEMTAERRPDVILLNLRMPHLDGYGVLHELRSRVATEDIPCVVFTGDVRYEQMGRAVMEGADAFLSKPAEPREVLRFVRELLQDGIAGPGDDHPDRPAS